MIHKKDPDSSSLLYLEGWRYGLVELLLSRSRQPALGEKLMDLFVYEEPISLSRYEIELIAQAATRLGIESECQKSGLLSK